MNAWKVLVGRITLFRGPLPWVPSLSALELYQRVWLGNPNNFQSSPNPLMPTIAQGKRGGFMAGCSVHPMRIDFNLTPPPPTSEAGSMSLPLIEDTSQLQGELERLIEFIGGSVCHRFCLSRGSLLAHSHFDAEYRRSQQDIGWGNTCSISCAINRRRRFHLPN